MIKCDANCDALGNIWLRNNVFYYIVELPRIDGKRRYFRKSLHTRDYFEARERVKLLLAGKEYAPRKQINLPYPDTEIKTPNQKITIGDVLESALIKANNCEQETTQKRNAIRTLLKQIKLTFNDDYSKLHNVKSVQKIIQNILAMDHLLGSGKRKKARYIKEVLRCGSDLYPQYFNPSVINCIPTIEKTKRSERRPHMPYLQKDLLNLFNPKHNHFKKHPDEFFVCMIAMFTGSRLNAAITLQFDDIIIKDGINCINFIENHPMKRLKTEASERIVPIAPQLLELGFWEYVKRQKKKRDAKGTDFIFTHCLTANGTYNNKYSRSLSGFVAKIGIRQPDNGKYDYHSFRKNASIGMQDTGIPTSYINQIIGWEGRTTMEASYSNHTLQQIYTQVKRFSYPYLQQHFDKWKQIMSKK
jgi:integrase